MVDVATHLLALEPALGPTQGGTLIAITVNRILPSQYVNALCICSQETQTNVHLFTNCVRTKNLWIFLKKTLVSNSVTNPVMFDNLSLFLFGIYVPPLKEDLYVYFLFNELPKQNIIILKLKINKMFTTFLIDIRENVPLQVNGKVLIYNDLNNIKK